MKLKLITILLLLTSFAKAQNVALAHKTIDTLTSAEFWGRGYTHDGVNKAARFIIEHFKSYGLTPMKGKDFLQPFNFDVNTFPGKMEVSVNGVALTPGKDFIVAPESRGINMEGELIQKDSVTFLNAKNRVIITLEGKLTASVEQKAADYTAIQIDKKALRSTPQSIKVNIENKLVSNFKTGNICGVVRGTEKPDSIIVFSAHYDHLGGLGSDTYFPGANDNASGLAMVLNLAKYYGAHPQKYTMAFICFAGEEAGLLGSRYFTEHPLVALSNIRFLINLDILGTGDEGVTAVNATVYPKEFTLLKQLNADGHYLAKIASRGKAANSDHYYFTEKGVPAFFIYTMGGIKAYHDVFDVSATLPLNAYEQLFTLFVKFSDGLMR